MECKSILLFLLSIKGVEDFSLIGLQRLDCSGLFLSVNIRGVLPPMAVDCQAESDDKFHLITVFHVPCNHLF